MFRKNREIVSEFKKGIIQNNEWCVVTIIQLLDAVTTQEAVCKAMGWIEKQPTNRGAYITAKCDTRCSNCRRFTELIYVNSSQNDNKSCYRKFKQTDSCVCHRVSLDFATIYNIRSTAQLI